MKKIILVLFLFLSCYFIYKWTIDDKIYYLTIGDYLSIGNNEYDTNGYSNYVKKYLENKDKLEGYNNNWTNKDYRITDLLRIIKYNETIEIDNQVISLNQLLKKADLITVSVGMNELYYKISLNIDNIYTYLDEMLQDMDELLGYIDLFNHHDVFVLGYYNVTDTNNDIFHYLNFKLEQLVLSYDYEYINLEEIFTKNPNYLIKDTNFIPNIEGYEEISKKIVEKLRKY